jgi:glycerol-3-phosphate acyltransferase PlsY
MWTEIKRKLFHLTGLVYVVGLIYIPRTAYIWTLTAVVAVVFTLEQIRLRVPAAHAWCERTVWHLFREHEREKMSGVFWMAEGAWITVLLLKSVPLASAALLYLLLGDAVASLAGKRLKGPKWPGSQKTVSGSAACFCMCLAIGVALLRPHYYEWSGIVAGAAVATLAEALPLRLNDNLTIPVAATLTFLACYR